MPCTQFDQPPPFYFQTIFSSDNPTHGNITQITKLYEKKGLQAYFLRVPSFTRITASDYPVLRRSFVFFFFYHPRIKHYPLLLVNTPERTSPWIFYSPLWCRRVCVSRSRFARSVRSTARTACWPRVLCSGSVLAPAPRRFCSLASPAPGRVLLLDK